MVKKILKAAVCNFLAVLMVFSLVAIPSSAASISLNYSSISLTKGYATTLKVRGTSSTPTWSTSDKTIATVSSSGRVVGKSAGTCYIYAKVGSTKVSCKVNVLYGRLSATDSEVSLESGDSEFVTITAKGSHALKVTTSDKSVAKATWESSFSGNDIDLKIKAIGPGTAKIKVYFKNYTSIYKYIYVTVDGATDNNNNNQTSGSIITSTTSTTVNTGSTTSISAYSTVANKLAVSFSDATVASATLGNWNGSYVDVSIKGLKAGTTTMKLYRTDNNAIYKNITVTVNGTQSYYTVLSTYPSKALSTDSVIEYQVNSYTKRYMLVPYGYDIAYVNTLFAANAGSYNYYTVYSSNPTYRATGDSVKTFTTYVNGTNSTRYVLLPSGYDEAKYNTEVAKYTNSYEYWTIYNSYPTKKYYTDVVMTWTFIDSQTNQTIYRYILLPYNYDTARYDNIVAADKNNAGTGSYYQVLATYPNKLPASTDKVIYSYDSVTSKYTYMIVPTVNCNFVERNDKIRAFTKVCNYYAIYSTAPTKQVSTDEIRTLTTSSNQQVYMLVPVTPDESKVADGLNGKLF